MNSILKKACENFANSLGFEIEECKNGRIMGYVSKISVSGDKNFDIYVVLPKEKLEFISEILLGDRESYDLEDLTNEIANLIIGNSKIVAGEENINFDISTPDFLGEYEGNIDYDDKLCFKADGIKFFILYKEK